MKLQYLNVHTANTRNELAHLVIGTIFLVLLVVVVVVVIAIATVVLVLVVVVVLIVLDSFFNDSAIITRIFLIQYKTPIAEACDYFRNSTLEEIAWLHRTQY